MRWTYRTAVADAWVENCIAIWRVVGVVTVEMLPELMVHAFAWHEEIRGLSLLADYRHAVMSAPLEYFLDVAGAIIKPPKAIAAPMVIVPAPEQVDYFRRYALVMCSRGVLRVVEPAFEKAQALAWEMGTIRLAEGVPGYNRDTRRPLQPARRKAASEDLKGSPPRKTPDFL